MAGSLVGTQTSGEMNLGQGSASHGHCGHLPGLGSAKFQCLEKSEAGRGGLSPRLTTCQHHQKDQEPLNLPLIRAQPTNLLPLRCVSHTRYRLDPYIVHVLSNPRYRLDPHRLPGLIASTLSTRSMSSRSYRIHAIDSIHIVQALSHPRYRLDPYIV